MAIQNGQITRPQVERLFTDFTKSFGTEISKKIDGILQDLTKNNSTRHNNSIEVVGDNESTESKYKMYHYDGRFWQVPKNFDFPAKTKRKRAWEF